MATGDDAGPEYPRAAPARERKVAGSHHPASPDFREMLRRQNEYAEVTALLNALRAAGFDLAEEHDDERLLTQMFEEWRLGYEARIARRQRRGKFWTWLAALLGGALVTLFGPDVHQWLKSHLH